MIEVFRIAVATLVSLLLFLVVLKVIWNLCLPYGMIRLKEGEGVSTFPLIEFVPLMIAILIAWVVGLTGWFSPKSIGFVGVVLISTSYVHFFVVLMVTGFVRSRQM